MYLNCDDDNFDIVTGTEYTEWKEKTKYEGEETGCEKMEKVSKWVSEWIKVKTVNVVPWCVYVWLYVCVYVYGGMREESWKNEKRRN